MEAKKKPVVSVPIHIRKNGKLPVGKQITRELIRLRSRGALKPGDRLPGIRSLASDLGVAPNTVAGAYAELSATGFAVSKRKQNRSRNPLAPYTRRFTPAP